MCIQNTRSFVIDSMRKKKPLPYFIAGITKKEKQKKKKKYYHNLPKKKGQILGQKRNTVRNGQ